jgi:hypothetical protein
MSVNVITGLTGSGKTYALLRLAMELDKKVPLKFKFFSSFHIDDSKFRHKIEFFNDPRKFAEMEQSVVLLDDAGKWFGAQDWAYLPQEIRFKIIDNRKSGLKVYCTSQSFNDLDSMIRRNCHRYYETVKVFGSDEFSDKVYGLIRLTEYDPRYWDKIRRERKTRRYFWLSSKHTRLYDTYEKVSNNSFVPQKSLKNIVKDQEKRQKDALDLEIKRTRARKRKVPIIAL